MKTPVYVLKEKEMDQMIVFDRIRNKELTQEEASNILRLSVRQVRRKLKKYLALGKVSLAHAGRGKKSNRATPTKLEKKIVEIINQNYSNLPEPKAGPTFLSEQLEKELKICIDHEVLRRIMIKNNLWSVSIKKQRKHVWRERKHHQGEMVQVDGSMHIWFGEEYSTLIAFIDDATGKILAAKFVDRESVENLAKLTKEYVKNTGRPLAFYTDRHSTYKVNNGIKRSETTEFHRMLKELDIELIHARSPQAKGRVVRLFKTMQDRLVKQLFLKNIKTINEANLFLQNSYLPEHNKKFAVVPLKKADYHRAWEDYYN